MLCSLFQDNLCSCSSRPSFQFPRITESIVMVLTYLLNREETRKYVSAQIDIEVGANFCTQSTAGVVASCKIPILATRVRFPGSAVFF